MTRAFVAAGLLLLVLLVLLAHPAGALAGEAGGPAASRTADADGVRLMVELDRARLRIDDQLRLTLRVEAPGEIYVTLPELADEPGRLTVVGRQTSEPRPAGSGGRLWERTYLLQPEDVGEIALPPVAITYQGPGGAPPERLAVEPLTVTVASVLPEDADVAQPKDIGPPVPLPASGWPPAVWAAAGLLLALLATLAAIAWRRRRRPARPAGSPGIPRPAHLVALEELDRLQRADLLARGRAGELYGRLADILRRYTLWRFGLQAPTRTTEELLAAFAGLGAGAHRSALAHLLAECDLVKFARHQPSGDAVRRALAGARDFIERTADPGIVVPDPPAELASAPETVRPPASIPSDSLLSPAPQP